MNATHDGRNAAVSTRGITRDIAPASSEAEPRRRPPMFEVICGDSREVVPHLEQVHMVFTSPPYWNKRTYGEDDAEVGQEGDVDAYLSSLVEIISEIPLHPRGSIWINIGDKRGPRGQLLDIPSRFSRAMGDAGFLLADHVIWAKAVVDGNGRTEGGFMPDPARCRLNGNAFEDLFRFVTTRRVSDAWTDSCAVAIPRANVEDVRHMPEDLMSCHTSIEGRGLPNVWRIPMGQTGAEHFGVFPPALVERPVAMTCPPWVNPDGSLPERMIDMVAYDEGRNSDRYFGKRSIVSPDETGVLRERCGRNDTGRTATARKPVTRGWSDMDAAGAPGIVLDPFCGSGTTGEVALKLGRRFIGIDLYEQHCALARGRCEETLAYLEEHGLDPLALMR